MDTDAADSIVTRKITAVPKKEIWSTLLQSVGNGKRLAEKQLLVLGGTPETQRDFIASIDTDSSKSTSRAQSSSKPPIANEFALGYTYQDVLDTDHEGMFHTPHLFV
jgi:dynein light intermediate chain 1, cytosolic